MLLKHLFVALLPQLALSLSVAHPNRNVAPLPPTKDPWYKAPPGDLSHYPPGHVFKVRHAPGNLTQILGKNCSDSYQILYRTTDAHYRPSWAVTTLFAPATNLSQKDDRPLLSYQIAYDTNNLDASPSAILYQPAYGSAIGNVPSALDDITPALGRGWFVNVPDYEGPLASFGLGVQEGHATIDSIRAVQSISEGPGSQTPTAMWGYSGGSIATEFAAELQTQYAPELTFRGIAIGGTLPNLTNTYDYFSRSALAGDLPNLLLGLVSQDKKAEEYLLSRLNKDGAYNKTSFLSVRDLELTEVIPDFAGQDIYRYFQGGKSDLVDPAVMKKLLDTTVAGYYGVPTSPMFVYKAIHDNVSPVEDTDELVARFCAAGAEIEYQRNTVGDHVDEIGNGDGRAVEFLRDVLEGRYKSSGGCVVKNVTVSVGH